MPEESHNSSRKKPSALDALVEENEPLPKALKAQLRESTVKASIGPVATVYLGKGLKLLFWAVVGAKAAEMASVEPAQAAGIAGTTFLVKVGTKVLGKEERQKGNNLLLPEMYNSGVYAADADHKTGAVSDKPPKHTFDKKRLKKLHQKMNDGVNTLSSKVRLSTGRLAAAATVAGAGAMAETDPGIIVLSCTAGAWVVGKLVQRQGDNHLVDTFATAAHNLGWRKGTAAAQGKRTRANGRMTRDAFQRPKF